MKKSELKKLIKEEIINFLLIENKNQTKKIFLDKRKLTQEEFNELEDIDPTPQKKYMFWMAKEYIDNHISFDDLRKYITEYDVLLGKHKIEERDIYKIKSFDELKQIINDINQRGSASLKELENDFSVIRNDKNLYIVSPNTYEASRKLGCSRFAGRGEEGSSWCTTYKNRSHFDSYYFSQDITFYYILVRGDLLKKIKTELGSSFEMVAFAVFNNGNIEAYDKNDKKLTNSQIKEFRKLIQI